eukprot:scaffold58_cov256-Pinguiococcus_pyrenoidosus.AAC.22
MQAALVMRVADQSLRSLHEILGALGHFVGGVYFKEFMIGDVAQVVAEVQKLELVPLPQQMHEQAPGHCKAMPKLLLVHGASPLRHAEEEVQGRPEAVELVRRFDFHHAILRRAVRPQLPDALLV